VDANQRIQKQAETEYLMKFLVWLCEKGLIDFTAKLHPQPFDPAKEEIQARIQDGLRERAKMEILAALNSCSMV
jgi:hypothetical protein